MNKPRCTLVEMFVAFLVVCPAWAGLIDDFSDTDAYPSTQNVVGYSVATFNDTNGPGLSNVFGDGSRTLQLQVTANPDPGNAMALSQVFPADHYWSTSNDPGVNSIARAIYTASGSGATVLPPSGSASNTLFRTTVLSADQYVDLTASFTDSATRTASFTWIGLTSGNVASALLSDFSNPAFDFAHVTGITVEMSGPLSWDASLGRLETLDATAVPEPSSLLLGLAVTGVVGLVATGRRRKRVKPLDSRAKRSSQCGENARL